MGFQRVLSFAKDSHRLDTNMSVSKSMAGSKKVKISTISSPGIHSSIASCIFPVESSKIVSDECMKAVILP